MTKKSALPGLNETLGFAGKIMRDLKKSVSEVIDDYQKARKDSDKSSTSKTKSSKKAAPKRESEKSANTKSRKKQTAVKPESKKKKD